MDIDRKMKCELGADTYQEYVSHVDLVRMFRVRSSASVGNFLVISCDDGSHVVLGKRGDSCPDVVGNEPIDENVVHFINDTIASLSEQHWNRIGSGMFCIEVYKGASYWCKICPFPVTICRHEDRVYVCRKMLELP